MRRLWMLLLEDAQLLLHVLVVSRGRSLDLLGNLLRGLGGFGCAALDLLCSAFHFLQCLKEPDGFVNVQLSHLSYRRPWIGLR